MPGRDRAANYLRPLGFAALAGALLVGIFIGAGHLAYHWLTQDVTRALAAGEIARNQALALQGDAIRTIVQVAGGLLLGVGLLFTYQQVRLSREGQITGRYTQAIEQLGSEHPALRIGGIYALERIARDSTRDHPTVMEVLSAFVRREAREEQNGSTPGGNEQKEGGGDARPKDQPPEYAIRPDIQAALTVLGRNPLPLRRRTSGGAEPLVLSLDGACLRGYSFKNAVLRNASLLNARLDGAVFDDSSLENVSLRHAVLSRGRFRSTSLKNVDVEGADLSEADLSGADLNALLNLDRARNRYGIRLSAEQVAAYAGEQTLFEEATVIGSSPGQVDRAEDEQARSAAELKPEETP